MQSVSSRIWTRIAVFISYGDNDYTTVSENFELFKKLEPGSQFHWERISPSDQPSRFTRGSETEPTINPRYSFFRDHERALDRGRFHMALRHARENSHARKALSHLRTTPYPSLTIGPGKPDFGKPMALEFRHPETPISKIMTADLSTNQRASTLPKEFEKVLFQRHPMFLRQRG